MYTMCPPGCYHNGFMATPELGHRMYGYTLLDCIVESREYIYIYLFIYLFIYLLNSQPRIMHLLRSDWFTKSRLSAHMP